MPFIPHTQEDTKTMLDDIGELSIEALFDEIPEELRNGQLQATPAGMSEIEVDERTRAPGCCADEFSWCRRI